MILVTGATGGLGSETIAALLQKTNAGNIAALVRNPEKAGDLRAKGIEIREGDYTNYDSLVKAFQGIEKLYFVSSNDLNDRLGQHQQVINAAKAAGVPLVVYSSFDRKTEDGSSAIAVVADSHLKTEQALRESGIAHTIMLHGLYTNLIPSFLGENVVSSGVIYQPSGDGKAAFTLRKDMAEAAAQVLTSEGHEGKTYRIVAEEAVSYADIAAALSGITGTNIQHVSPTTEEYIQTLVGFGVPANAAGFYAAFSKAIEQGEFENTNSDIALLTGKKPVTVADFLKSVYSAQ